MPADFLSEKAVAALLHRSVVTLRSWRRRQCAPPFYRINARVFYRWPEVENWIAERRR